MEVEADIGTEQILQESSEPFFGPIDIFLLVALLGTAAWWVLRNKKKKDVAAAMGRTYSIQ